MGANTYSDAGPGRAALGSIQPKETPMKTVVQPSAWQQPEAEHGPRPRPALIRVLVVDDHPAVRIGLRELLEADGHFLIVDAVGSAEVAMTVAEREWIDVAVVDYHLGGRNGLWLSRKLKRLPHPPRVVIYSAYYDGLLAAAAVVAEADGLISKGSLGSELTAAIARVARGHLVLPSIPPHLADMLRRQLDQAEQAIFGMLLAGIPPQEIASTLNMSSGALESRQWAMLRKLENGQLGSTAPKSPSGAERRRTPHRSAAQ
jgi:DNA-binding NarL/FixJ family response regulator